MICSGFDSIGPQGEAHLSWLCDPRGWAPAENEREGQGGDWRVEEGKLVISAPAKKDYWRKTYYSPVLVKDDGPCLVATLPAERCVTVSASFTLQPKRQVT